jgi:hypothetical protein
LFSNPPSVWLLISGPQGDRDVVGVAYDERELQAHLGRLLMTGEGTKLVNPEVREMPILGKPNPESLEAVGEMVADRITKIGNKIVSQWDKGI